MVRVQTAEVALIDESPRVRGGDSLEVLYARHQGKVADTWAAYLRQYDRLLRDYRERPIRLFEIGVQNGGSLEIWAQYFAKAQAIIGCDINPECQKLTFDDRRIAFISGDANSDEVQRAVVAYAHELDLVIDDGSHRSSDIIKSFARYFPMLADGGMFVIEDLHCSYWHEFEGGLFHPYSAMTFLKRLADMINHEHWGVPKLRSELVRGISKQYEISLSDHELGRINSIEFSNSVCVIRKAPTDDNALGRRVIGGSEADVYDTVLGLQASHRTDMTPQTGNPASVAEEPPEEELIRLRAAVAPLAEHIALVEALRRELEQRDAAIAGLQQQVAEQAASRSGLEQRLSELRGERDRWQTALFERDRQLAHVASELAAAVSGRERDHRGARRERDAIQKNLQRAEGELSALRAELKRRDGTVYRRLTKPLRQAAKSVGTLVPEGKHTLAVRRARKVLRQGGIFGATKRAFELITGRPSRAVQTNQSVPLPRPLSKQRIDQQNYAEWIKRHDTLSPAERAGLADRARLLPSYPLISVVLATRDPDVRLLQVAINSLRQQIYPRWELCIVDAGSCDPSLGDMLRRCAEEDPRIRVSIGEPYESTPSAINAGFAMANGEWLVVMNQHDVLREHALFWIADATNATPAPRMIYSDDDSILETGVRQQPRFKPDWNPELFLSHNMFGPLVVYEAGLVRALEGYRAQFGGAADYDFALRSKERLEPSQIYHVPRVLYSVRVEDTASKGKEPSTSKLAIALAGKRAVEEHLARTGADATVELEQELTYRTRYTLPQKQPLVSLIIPTRDALSLVRQCIDSVVRRTSYQNYEIILMDNGSEDPDALKYFSELAKDEIVRLVRDDRPFNYSALNNAAVGLARGEFVCLLNNDIEVISSDWLSEMVRIALQPGVGAVGARLWYPNNSLQHGGVILGLGGVAGHSHKGLTRDDRGYLGRAALVQSLSAVTGACLLVRKDIYQEVGGLNEQELKVAFNDVDFCLRVREAGYRNIWTPHAELYHHESATRGVEDNPVKLGRLEHEARYMKARWGALLSRDPAYSPNLALDREDFSWAAHPRL